MFSEPALRSVRLDHVVGPDLDHIQRLDHFVRSQNNLRDPMTSH
jgi:hypothetical protein